MLKIIFWYVFYQQKSFDWINGRVVKGDSFENCCAKRAWVRIPFYLITLIKIWKPQLLKLKH